MGIETATLALYASLAVSLAGAGMSYSATRKQEKQAEQVGIYNAKLAQDAANNEALAARENQKRQREENRRRLSSIRAQQARSGVQIGTGSTLDVLGEAAAELELQTLDVFRESDARIRALQGQGAMSLWEGGQTASAARTQSIGTLLGGVSSAAGAYASGWNSGATGGGSSVRRTGTL